MTDKIIRIPESHESNLLACLNTFRDLIKDLDVLRAIDDLRWQVNIFVGKKIALEKRGKIEKKMSREKRFYKLFCERYLSKWDIEYGDSSPKEMKQIKMFLQKLDRFGASMEMYIDWYFDEFWHTLRGDTIPNIGALIEEKFVFAQFKHRKVKTVKSEQIRRRNDRQALIYIEKIQAWIRRGDIVPEKIMESIKTLMSQWRRNSVVFSEFEARFKSAELGLKNYEKQTGVKIL